MLPPPPRRFYPICLPSTSSASPLTRAESPRFSTNLAAAQKAPPVFTTTSSGGARPDWLKHLMVRRRIGRGGRIIFDRLVDRRAEAQPRVPPAHGYLPGEDLTLIADALYALIYALLKKPGNANSLFMCISSIFKAGSLLLIILLEICQKKEKKDPRWCQSQSVQSIILNKKSRIMRSEQEMKCQKAYIIF